MSRKRSFVKTISIILSLLILLTVLPLGVSAADTNAVTPEAETRDVTIEDVIAGAASIDDLPYEYETPKLGDAMPWFDLTSAEESTEPQGDYSLNTTVTDNGDGTYTMTLYDHPVKYVDEKGDVQDISLEIASAADGSYKTKANDIQTVFPKKISDGITLSGNGVSVKLTPSVQPPSEREVAAKPSEGVIERSVNENTSSTVFDGPPSPQGEGSVGNDALVVPGVVPIIADSTVTRLDSETVSYYYDNRTTLEYSLTYTGFKEDIVVSEYTGQTEYHFLLETGGLTLTKIDESYYLTDAEGNIKATLGDIIIFTADERNNTLGSMTHTTVREDQQYIVTIHIDADYLKDEKTKYPIRIDPTIEITYDGNGASAIQDVTLNQNSGSSGTSGSLYVGKRNTYGISRTLMKFPGLNLNSIPSNCTIDSAYIEIRDLMCETTAMTVNAAMFMGNDWNESTANWSNTNPNLYTPISGGSVSVSYSNGTAVSPNHRYSINITKAVRLWKSGFYPHAKGIILKADDSVENGSSALYKTFASYNRASNKPSLKINYTSNVTHTAYGWLGFVNSSVINGWVWCSNHPSETLDVVLTITKTGTNQSWRTVGPASIYRSDVKDAGYGTGNYGFSCSMGDWASFTPGDYSVSAEAVLPNGSKYTLHASPKTYIVDSYPQHLDNGEYYINNKGSGKFIFEYASMLANASNTIELMDSHGKWMLTKYDGGYTIKNVFRNTYLTVSGSSCTIASVSGNISDEFIWDLAVRSDVGGGVALRNRYNGKYFYDNGSILGFESSIGSDSTGYTWRIVSTASYGNASGYEYRQLTDDAFFSNVDVMVGHSASMLFAPVVTNTLWCDPSDFMYTISVGEPSTAEKTISEFSLNHATGVITGVTAGDEHPTFIQCTHKVTGQTFDAVRVLVWPALPDEMIDVFTIWNSVSHSVGYWAQDVVNVYVKVLDATGQEATYATTAMTEAINYWDSVLPTIQVLEVENENDANIICYVGTDDAINSTGRITVLDGSLGGTIDESYTNKFYYQHDQNSKIFKQIHSAVIYISPYGDVQIETYDHYSVVARHELGHALGYSGHSSSKGDIMYPSSNKDSPTLLSTNELYFIRKVYQLAESYQELEEESE